MRCPSCQTPVHGRFCPNCGRDVQGAAAASRALGPWLYGGGALVLAAVFGLGLLVGKGRGGAPAAAEGVASGPAQAAAPDISNMSPRERFDRLYERIMRASSSGDAATVQQFSPMAISAYGMLDSVDIDARYDVAVIKLHMGDIAGTTALADTIVKKAPTHLFGYMLRATVARFGGDSVGAKAARAAFLRNYAAESRRARPEYAKHQSAIDTFKREAEGGQ